MDAQRIGRALEVFRATGRPLSAFHIKNKQPRQSEQPAQILNQPGVLVSLEPAHRAWLHQRIEERFDAMLAHGFLDEARSLMQRPGFDPDLPSMRCVGYRQAFEALASTHEWSKPALAELRNRGIYATRQLAKRQLTWLRSMPQRRILPADDPDVLSTWLGLCSQA
jgi:tRNA dimethylallyltransferase